ncbi:hypothetical protein FHS85_004547 [Rhodoligotrophos appendicifer]|uniref:hypothetical protein n=1 Tax=Rhodoligotrophos appendicifer TaxID=987056 RepID=UPI0011860684|nr:hypothetical protein [Rhodoligotrophos appendicifer]
MATDVKLNNGSHQDWVTIEAVVLETKASDFMLHADARRSSHGGRFRRALVHGEDDSLIVNFAHDYPGGTKINSGVVNLKLEKQSSGDAMLPKSAQIGDLKLIQTTISGPVPGTTFMDTRPGPVNLWLCVGQTEIGGEAQWSQVMLGDPVVGTR